MANAGLTQLSFEHCVRQKPRSRSSSSSLHATTARSNSLGSVTSHDAEQICQEQVSTPKVLWAATPSPDASGEIEHSFALPPSELSADAHVFVPRVHQEPGALFESLMAPSGEPAESRLLLQDHAEAQAVLMAELVLDLDEPQALPTVSGAVFSELQQRVACPEVTDVGEAMALLPSKGSALHASGRCKPCAWMWKPRGCQNAQQCEYCHLCPEDELKKRKKVKVAAIRKGALAPCYSTVSAADKLGTHKNLKLFELL
mmetsp:Transcript_98822/g.176019  ORF Transcript_98822/g.176019 Transcript_98822/m.176019 type:complete len:258 (-) Transcript_98822:192-965(-)